MSASDPCDRRLGSESDPKLTLSLSLHLRFHDTFFRNGDIGREQPLDQLINNSLTNTVFTHVNRVDHERGAFMRGIGRFASFALFTSATFLGISSPAVATTSVFVQATGVNGVSGTQSASISNTGTYGSASATAFAAQGINKTAGVSSTALPSTPVPGATVQQWSGYGQSQWNDVVTLSSPGTASGFINALFLVDSTLVAGAGSGLGQSISTVIFQFTAGSSTSFSYNATLDPSGLGVTWGGSGATPTWIGPSSVLVALSIPYFDGSAFGLTSFLSCQSTSDASTFGDIASGSCHADQSAYWAGIVNVTDSLGNPLTGWSITSASGTDYSQSFVPSGIPEPGTWAMMLFGFGVIGAAMRRRRRKENLAQAA